MFISDILSLYASLCHLSCSHCSPCVSLLLHAGGLVYLLDLYCNSKNPTVRISTASLFAKILSDKLRGPKVFLVWFFSLLVLVQLVVPSSSALLQSCDQIQWHLSFLILLTTRCALSCPSSCLSSLWTPCGTILRPASPCLKVR